MKGILLPPLSTAKDGPKIDQTQTNITEDNLKPLDSWVVSRLAAYSFELKFEFNAYGWSSFAGWSSLNVCKGYVK